MPTSSEFLTVCQAQVALLSQGLGAALSIVYLTEELSSSTDPQLVPLVAYPEVALNWGEEQIFSFLTQVGMQSRQRLLAETAVAPGWVDTAEPEASTAHQILPSKTLLPQQQIVLPLIYQDQVMGLLITARADRGWTETEQRQIEQIAQTLTAARVLDWRVQWLAQDLQQQQILEERKNDLLDDLLHQFRNPMTAVRTFGKLLTKRLRQGDDNHSVAESIVRESDRMQDLLKQIDAAIDLEAEALPIFDPEVAPASSRPNASLPLPSAESRLLLGSAIDLHACPIAEVLQPLLDSALAIAQDRQLVLETMISENLPAVLIDPRALREVLSNLIDNALKYTPAGGQILVSVQREASPSGRQVIIVADTGAGIPLEDLHHLFERHYRGVQASTNIPGTGLGLAIARDLVQQMQGEIKIFSPAIACGCLPTSTQFFRPRGGTAAVVWLVEAP